MILIKSNINSICKSVVLLFLTVALDCHAQLDQYTPQRIDFFESNKVSLKGNDLPGGRFELQCPQKINGRVQMVQKQWESLVSGPIAKKDSSYCDRNQGWVVVNNGKMSCCAWEPQLRFVYDNLRKRQQAAPVMDSRNPLAGLHAQVNSTGNSEAQSVVSDIEFVESIFDQTLSAPMQVLCPLKGHSKPRPEPWSCASVIGSPSSFDLSFVSGSIAPCKGLFLVRSCSGDDGIALAKTCCASAGELRQAAYATRGLQSMAKNFNNNQEVKSQAGALEEQQRAIEMQSRAQQELWERQQELFKQNQSQWEQYQKNMAQQQEWAQKESQALLEKQYKAAQHAEAEQRRRYENNQVLLNQQLQAKKESERKRWIEEQKRLQANQAQAEDNARKAQTRAQSQVQAVDRAMADSSVDQSSDHRSWLSSLFQPRRRSGSEGQVGIPGSPSSPQNSYLEQIAMYYSQRRYDRDRVFLGRKNFFESSKHCFMHVKFVLEAYDAKNCWNRKVLGGDGKGQGLAKNSGIDFAKLGYSKIEDPRAGNNDQRRIRLAPAGSVIVYQDCDPSLEDPGHIEIKVRDNFFASDFVSSGPQACTGVSVWKKAGCP